MDPNDTTSFSPEPQKSFFGQISDHVIDFIQTLVVFGAIFALIYLFIAQPHKVSGNSMHPTFYDGDYILTDKLSYRLNLPKHGDVIVLKNPKDESQDFIKRIIAVPGDTIMISNNAVYLNGIPLKESYLPANIIIRGGTFLTENAPVKAGPNQYFVLGDNRAHSSDSREWGSVTKEEIIGKTFFRYFPLNHFGIFNPVP